MLLTDLHNSLAVFCSLMVGVRVRVRVRVRAVLCGLVVGSFLCIPQYGSSVGH